jgi:UDP-glucose 4-epimerase
MRFLLAGGLGYIGSAVCELSRSTPQHELLVVDRRFVPERVARLPRRCRFIQGDVGDAALMRPLLAEVDVLLLLAAEVEAESSIDRSRSVWDANFEMPKRLIELCPSSVRVMFASTGNVFGGLEAGRKYLGLTEEDQPRPKYPYAEAKRAVEQVLLGSSRDFVILRFGTNYGFSPGIRFNLVTNSFIRRCLLDEDLVVHGDGQNWRPTVCVSDCARALMFLSDRREARGEVFHVVRENYRIRELAERIVALSESESRLELVAREVPFNSYALSSDRIRRLGFAFEWDLERAVGQMLEMFAPLRDGKPLLPCTTERSR